MSNKAQDHVHRLVHSMSRAEKRYFKVFTGGRAAGGGGNQHRLFDAIAAMPEYDEQALLLRFKGEACTNRFAVTKRRLYESILRSLDAFHAEHSVDARLARQLHQVELLFQRALYEDAARMLHSAARMARQHDRQGVLITVMDLERRIRESNNYADTSTDDLQRLASEADAIRAEQAECDALWDLKSRLLMDLYRNGLVRDAEGTEQVKALLRHPLLGDPEHLRTARARFLHHHVHSAAAFALGDLPACRDHLLANRELLMAQRDRFPDAPGMAMGVLSNLCHVQMRMAQHQEAAATLKEFRMLPARWDLPESDDLDLRLFVTSTSLELALHGQAGTFHEALALLPSMERRLAAMESRLSAVRKAGFYYQIAYVYFGAGKHEAAQKWAQRLLNDVRIDDSAEIVCFGRILYMLCLWENGKTDLIPYVLRNTERFLQTRQRSYRAELLFLELMKGLLRSRSELDHARVIEHALHAFAALADRPTEHAVFEHLDPIAWCSGKLTGRPFATVVQERAGGLGRAA